jgi:hypothetical protein
MFKLLVCAVGLFAAAAIPASAQEADHTQHMRDCSKVCAACQLECDFCFAHCKQHVVQGHKEHAATMQLCVDCADCCKLAASLTSRLSPLSVDACDCCAKCCDKCAEACEKNKDDKQMSQCAKACRDCSKACRDMIEHMKK